MPKDYDQEEDTIEKLKKANQIRKDDEGTNNEAELEIPILRTDDGELIPEAEIILGWEALEREHYTKGTGWYIGVIIFMILGVLYGVYSTSWPMIIVFILLAVCMILYANKPPFNIPIFITERGIFVRTKFIPFENIGFFWITRTSAGNKFGFRENKGFQIEREILLHDIDPDMIREILSEYLEENTKKQEHVVHKMTRWFRL